jgi:hypothetical protein
MRIRLGQDGMLLISVYSGEHAGFPPGYRRVDSHHEEFFLEAGLMMTGTIQEQR